MFFIAFCLLYNQNGVLLYILKSPSRVWLSVSPWAITHQAPLSVEFSRQEYWSVLPCPPPGDLSDPGIEPTSLVSPAVQFSSVQSLSRVQLLATPWTVAHQASLSITNSKTPLKPMSTELVMPSNHLILCRPLLLLPSIFSNIRWVFSNESALCTRWPKYWSFTFNISPSNEHPGLISLRMDWLDLLVAQGTL